MRIHLPVSSKSELFSGGQGDGISRIHVSRLLDIAFAQSEINLRIIDDFFFISSNNH